MRRFIYSNKPLELCYGCRACEQICPHNAICIIQNEEKFIYPHIDTKKCVDCGLCEKICPTQDKNKDKILYQTPNICYAAWNKDLNSRLIATSGGIFSLIAKIFINKGGVVYGSAMNKDLIAQHIRITDASMLHLLSGSKYMQSNTNNTYSQVKEDLKLGKKVLYSGTPCQIAGLRSFLIKNYDNLYTIDLVCHGTPSPSIFNEHLKYLETQNKKKIIAYSFRYKKRTGWGPYISYKFETGERSTKMLGEDFYAQCFYSSFINRKSCYICEYSQSKRVGDITLSDFWGSEKHIKELRKVRKYGYNMVMCNTLKGESLLSDINQNINKIPCNIDIAINGDIRLKQATQEPDIRKEIYADYIKYGYLYIVNKYSRKIPFINKIIPSWIKNIIKDIKSLL